MQKWRVLVLYKGVQAETGQEAEEKVDEHLDGMGACAEVEGWTATTLDDGWPEELPVVCCNVHRTQRLTVEEREGDLFIKPCDLCKKVAMVKVKRRLRGHLEGFLRLTVLDEPKGG